MIECMRDLEEKVKELEAKGSTVIVLSIQEAKNLIADYENSTDPLNFAEED